MKPVSGTEAEDVAQHLKAVWSMRGSWFLQMGVENCSASGADGCTSEGVTVIMLLIFLCTILFLIMCAFAFFREDKEEQITPLCPQLVVRDADLEFKMPVDVQADSFPVTDLKGNIIVKVALDWPDPFRPGTPGVAATVRMQSSADSTLATVVARNLAVAGQGLALCRARCESFGFVEPDGPRMYHIRHRTGIHLLTLVGDFGGSPGGQIDVEGMNPVGSKVCSFKTDGFECKGWVLQHFDAGLVICGLLAIQVHKRLAISPPTPQGLGTDANSENEKV